MSKYKRATVFLEGVKIRGLKEMGIRNPILTYLAVLGLSEMLIRFGNMQKFKKVCQQIIAPNTVLKQIKKLSGAKNVMGRISSSDLPARFVELRDSVLSRFKDLDKSVVPSEKKPPA